MTWLRLAAVAGLCGAAVAAQPWAHHAQANLETARRNIPGLAAAPAAPPALPAHPRVGLTPARLAEIEAAVAAGGDAAQLYEQLREHAEWVITQPPVPRGTPGPSGVLMAVRQALDFLETSAMAWVLSGDARYLERGCVEAVNVCGDGWVDWNPYQHTLDVGEMVGAVAQFYDWTYGALNSTMQALVSGAIVSKGLAPLSKGINNATHSFWWLNNTINWNCVISAGGMAGVLAVADEPGNAQYWPQVFQPLLQSIPVCIAAYTPEGSWREGAGYWGYASKMNVLAFTVLNTSLGTDYGLSDIPGVREAGTFELQMSGARAGAGDAEVFDWADSETGEGLFPFAQYWGNRWGDGTAAYFSRLIALQSGGASVNASGTWGGFSEALLHFSPLGDASTLTELQTAHLYPFIQVASIRSTWASANASLEHVLFAKGGDSSFNHNHLDLGSWVFDFAGFRFVHDLGADSYNLPGYFNNDIRFTYYRLGSHGHNVPMLGGRNQTFPAAAEILAWTNTSAPQYDGFIVFNLTQAYAEDYAGGAASLLRGIVALPGTRGVVVVDEVVYGSQLPVNLTSAVHTRALTFLHSNGTSAELVYGQPAVTVNAALLSAAAGAACPGAQLLNSTIVLPPGQNSMAGYTRVDAFSGSPAGCTRLAFALGDPALVGGPTGLQDASLKLNAVEDWATAGPFQA